MNINLISKHRNSLLAFAMLWVAVHHSYFPITFKPFAFCIMTCGFGGVDMFLFLSSFGLYYAYKKNNDYLHFIKRRLLRVLPYTIPIFILYMFINDVSFIDTLLYSFGLSIFFRRDLSFWFISFILILYFVTPIYLKYFMKKPYLSTLVGSILTIVICLLFDEYRKVYIWFRIIIYLLGFLVAYLNDQKSEKIKASHCWISVGIMVIGWAMLYYEYHFISNGVKHVLPFVFIIPGLCLLIAWIIEKISFLQKPLEFFGKYTLQFYMIHENLINLLYAHYGELYIPGIKFDWLINFAGIILALIIAIIYKKIVDFIIDSFSKRTICQ